MRSPTRSARVLCGVVMLSSSEEANVPTTAASTRAASRCLSSTTSLCSRDKFDHVVRTTEAKRRALVTELERAGQKTAAPRGQAIER
jgi:hypothetical protein